MKNIIFNKLFPLLFFGTLIYTSCEKDYTGKYEMTDGLPVVSYIRPQDAAKSDSLLVGAYFNENICLVGENLTSVQQVYFNDVKARLNINFITENTLMLQVPNTMPTVVTHKMYLVTARLDTVVVDFIVRMPAPAIYNFKCEWTPPGQIAEINGDYFLEPLELSVGTEKIPAGDILSIEKTKIRFISPDIDVKGNPAVKTDYGYMKSDLVFRDERGLITGFEPGFVGGWGRPSATLIANDPEYAINGNYLRMEKTIAIDDNGWKSAYDNGEFMINIFGGDYGIPDGGRLFSSDPATSILKLEVNVLTPWSAGPMIFVFEGNETESWVWDDWRPRYAWVPWLTAEGGKYVSNGWVTVAVPLKDIKYKGNGEITDLSKNFHSLGIGINNRGNAAWAGVAECTPIILFDNIRVIPGN